jgi:hypothetical protein
MYLKIAVVLPVPGSESSSSRFVGIVLLCVNPIEGSYHGKSSGVNNIF